MRPALAFLLLAFLAASSLTLAQGGGHVITGVVRDETSNRPLGAVKLELSSSGLQAKPSITSGMDGEFTFTGLADGEYSVVATKAGYDPVTVGVTIMRSGTQPVMILLHPSAAEKPITIGNYVSAHELSVPARARAAYEKGCGLLEEQKKAAESIPEFQQAVKAFPGYYEAYTKIGVANYQLGKFPETEAALKKAVELSSGKYLEPLYLLADLYNGQRKYQEAADLARKATALDEFTWNSHFELARALVGLKDGAGAEASALRACELKPDSAPAHLVLANAHLLLRNYPAAVRDFDTYLNLEPEGPLSAAVRQNREKILQQLQQPSNGQQSTAPSPSVQKA